MKKPPALALILAVVLFAGFLGAFSGCGGNAVRVGLEGLPASLDPQVESGKDGDSLFSFLFSQLIYIDEDGAVGCESAEQFYFSDGGMTLTFVLKNNLLWTNGEKVTSHDYAFAVRRILSPETGSPYAGLLFSIAGAEDFYGRRGPLSGVSCPNDTTLVLNLTGPDDSIIHNFAAPFLSPCNEAFFESTQGAYGITTAKTLANGLYSIKSRGSSSVVLAKKDSSPRHLPDEVTFFAAASASASDLEKQVSKGQLAFYSGLEKLAVDENKCRGLFSSKKTWALLVGESDGLTGDPRFAQALALGGIGEFAAKNSVGDLLPSEYADIYLERRMPGRAADNGGASARINALLGEYRYTSLPSITLAVPDLAEARALSDTLVSLWQKNIGVFVNREYCPAAEAAQRLASGRCQLAILPLEYKATTPKAFYKGAAALLGGEAAQKLSEIPVSGISDYCFAAEDMFFSLDRIFPFARSDTFMYITADYLYYERRTGVCELVR